MAVNVTPIRDTKWLTLEVCREFQRGTCSRPDSECKFAHPAKSCQVENGRVIACFDSLKGRCSRENCKYLHPPPHLKTQLEINGRNNLIQQKNMAMLAQQMQLANAMLPGTQLQPVLWGREALQPMFSVAPSLATNATAAAAFNPYLGPVSPGLMQAEILPSAPMLMTGNPNVPVPSAAAAAAQKLMRTDRLEVCREYQRGNCTRGENDCRFAHPADSTMIDTNDNTVTVCMDYIKGRCSREKCKYFHPPAHLQAKIKAAQHQVNKLLQQLPWESQPEFCLLSTASSLYSVRLNIVHDTCNKCCSHDARCYTSHCVCSNHICHKCSLRNCHSQSDSDNICRSSD
ncbi:hypothetical protein ANANG_G00234780 [Anguilla anguilla]|uniref:C3H1-type domain-containing protein n=1 Tax=Anguilla anguilla TaxID=7936 RepID=A0A9D3LY29_ANGAN|nr:hypothetical protein ANANG_G00234780 [Anguilla anguilla]